MNCKNKKMFIDKNENIDIILGGKGKEYSAVSRELAETFCNWLAFAEIDEDEFSRRLSKEPHRIEQRKNFIGEIEIYIMSGGESVIVPLVYKPNRTGSYEGFIVDALLLLHYTASRYDNESFRRAVVEFSKNIYAENDFLHNDSF